MSEIQRVGPYLLGEHLATGGMGEVYRGMHERLHRPVALKQIRADRIGKSQARRRFLREARATARLNHPSIVQVHDIFEEDGSDWLVMEFVEGLTLKQMLEDGPLPWPRMVQIGVRISEGLAAAHEAGIIHRDLKTENVIVTARGQVKILDFGLAKSTQSEEEFDPGISHDDAVVGTPRAMSPEQAQGGEIDPRTDIFSFGTLLYETLTGVSPFVGASTLETLTRICHRPHETVRRYVPAIPDPLSACVDHFLKKEASERPDAQAAAETLRRIAWTVSPEDQTAQVAKPDEPTLIDAAPPILDDAPTMPERPPTRPARPSAKAQERDPSGASTTAHPRDLLGSSAGTSSTATVPALLRERRQVTLLWCHLDIPEEDEETVAELHLKIREACEPFQARFTEVPGDHLLVCFGFPVARENDPLRAVHAAQAVVEAFDAPEKFRIRLGIHTGPAVVVPELAQSEPLAFGVTLDRATSIGRRAGAKEIFLSHVTRRLVGEAVRVEECPSIVLPGDGEARPLFRVVALRSEGALLRGRGALPLIGRDPELDLLLACWKRAAAGRFQVAEVCGEAGIGKSRLVQALRDRVAHPELWDSGSYESEVEPQWIAVAGSPFARRLPLRPILQALRELLELDVAAPEEEQISRLDDVLKRYEIDPTQTLPLLAAQLSLTLPKSSAGTIRITQPQKRLRLTLEAIVALLLSHCEGRPTVLLIEDLHKVDPTTLDLLQMLVQQEAEVPLLLVLTLRPELMTPWSRRGDLVQIRLQPLTAKHSARMLDRMVASRQLPARLRDQILDRADGVPLFLEEVTKVLLEADDLDRSTSQLPLSLRDSLAARLDRLESARAIAQTAAVIGREFSFGLLRPLTSLSLDGLQDQLDQLVSAGILLRRGFGSKARFVFKHALIRDAAYESLLPRARRAAHAKVLEALQEHFPESVRRDPEVIAYHAEAAGDTETAVRALRRAGDAAVERSALLEAAESYRHALQLLSTLRSSTERDQAELSLRLALGSTAMSIDGYGAPEVGECYARAEELCQSLDDEERLFSVLWGLYAFRVVRAELSRALSVGSQLLQIADDNDEPLQRLEAHQANGLIRFYRGTALSTTLAYLDRAAELESPSRDRSLSFKLRHHDVGVTHLSFWGLAAWMNGETEVAIERCDSALELARRLERPYSLTFALNYEAWLGFLLQDPERTLRHADEELRIAEEHGFFWMHIATIFRGWAIAEQGRVRHGLQLVQRGRTGYLATGARLGQTLHLAIEADLCLRSDRIDDAGDALDEAMMMAEGTGEQFWESELWRLRGRWLLATGEAARASEAFGRAVETARRHGCKALEERARESLSRHG